MWSIWNNKIHTIENILNKSILNKYLKSELSLLLSSFKLQTHCNFLITTNLFQQFYFILFYYQTTIAQVQHSINTSIGKCLAKNNQELKKDLEKTFEKFCIPKIKKTKEWQLKKVTMNIAISEACKQLCDAEKGKIEIRPAIPFVPESTMESDRINKNQGRIYFSNL